MKHQLTLGAKVLIVGLPVAGLVLVSTLVLFLVNLEARKELSEATGSFVGEQRIADQINRTLLWQLSSVATFRAQSPEAGRADFEAAGEEVVRLIRQFLRGGLSPLERIQLERVREDHQLMEVAGVRVAASLSQGDEQGALEVEGEVLAHTLALLESLDGFLRLRAGRLEALESRQDRLFITLLMGIAAMGLVVFFGSLLVVFTIRRRIAEPLKALAEATERMEQGDLTVRVEPGTDPEFRLLADRFNRMGEGLQRSQAELVRSENLSAMGRMTAGLAHELNNPLASVLGYAQLLAADLSRGMVPSQEALQTQYLEPIVHEAARAQHLVRNFLDFARPSGIALGNVQLGHCLERVLGVHMPSVTAAGVRLEVEPFPEVWVRADEQLLEGVFVNLLSNALDALRGRDGPVIRVRGKVAPERVHIVFEDNGPGMESPEQAFEAFYTTKPTGQGTGLGLSVAYQAMTRFGGALSGENRPEGGARFVVELVRAEGAAGALASNHPPIGHENSWNRGEGGQDGPLVAAPNPAGVPSSAPRILVVEDEAPIRTLHQRILKKLDAQVFLAASAAEAREILGHEVVDLVLCDVRMPDENGLQFYGWLREAHPTLAEHRFLFVTGDVRGEDIKVLADAEPERFIQKPFRLSEYMDRVQAALGLREGSA